MAIKKAEYEQRQALLNNPVQMERIRKVSLLDLSGIICNSMSLLYCNMLEFDIMWYFIWATKKNIRLRHVVFVSYHMICICMCDFFFQIQVVKVVFWYINISRKLTWENISFEQDGRIHLSNVKNWRSLLDVRDSQKRENVQVWAENGQEAEERGETSG